MKAITIAAAAKRLNIDEREVKNMCKNGSLELSEIPGELPGVTEESVCEFLGEDYEEKEPATAQKRRGRQPSVLSSEEAAKLLGKSADDIVQMAYDDILEEWVLPDSKSFAVTKRSVDAFMKANTTTQSDESVEEVEEHNNNPAMSEEEELNEDVTDIDVGEMVEEKEPVEVIEEEENLDGLDESLDEGLDEEEAEPVEVQKSPVQDLLALAENDEESFDDFIHLIADTIEEETAAIQKAIQRVPILERQTFTMTKRDFQAHLNIASMKAELDVYRSLKSFERM